jgi:hypothetical protein
MQLDDDGGAAETARETTLVVGAVALRTVAVPRR